MNEDIVITQTRSSESLVVIDEIQTYDVDKRSRFSNLCQHFETLEKESSTKKRKERLDEIWKHLKKRGADYYPFMRLMIPQCDKVRAIYGMKEAQLALQIIAIVPLNGNCEDALKLKNYKDPGTHSNGNYFADVVYDILKRRSWTGKGTLTVHSLNEHLNEICKADVAQKRVLMGKLIRLASALEVKWILRIILKDMHYHMGEDTILNHFHPRAKSIYLNCNDLRIACTKCFDEDYQMDTKPFQVFTPMLASPRVDISGIDFTHCSSYVFEPKYDGERVVIHKQGLSIKYYTRNGVEYTRHYASKFDRFVRKCTSDLKSCILDGEMMVYSKVMGTFKEFSSNAEHATRGNEDEEHFCFCTFDILHADEESLFEKPLSYRRQFLERTIHTEPTHFEIVPQTPLSNSDQLIKALEDAIGDRYEGIVIKQTGSKYEPGARDSRWTKLKPYNINVADTVDAIIVGGYYGTRFGKKSISHFLVAVLDTESNKWKTLTKVGSGFREEELLKLQSDLRDHWSPYKGVPKEWSSWTPEKQHTPDVVIEPHKSKVIEIACQSISTSTSMSSGYSLRFPQAKRVRSDKDYTQCCTMSLLRELVAASDDPERKRITGKASPKKRKSTSHEESLPSKRARFTVMSSFAETDVSKVEVESNILFGTEVCLLSDSKEHSKLDIEIMIKKYGGKSVQNPSDNTNYIVVGDETLRVKNFIASSKMGNRFETKDVLHLSWLKSCFDANRLIVPTARDMLFVGKITEAKTRASNDSFGDSFFEDATEPSLKESFQSVGEQMEEDDINADELNSIRMKMRAKMPERFFFEKIIAVCEPGVSGICPLNIKSFGGIINNEDMIITHIIVSDDASGALNEYEQRDNATVIVREAWIDQCVKHRRLLDASPWIV